jgi:hypothetical protein
MPISYGEGLANDCLVLGEVPLGDDPTHTEDVAREPPPELALVHDLRAPLPYRLQRVSQLGETHLLPLEVDPAILVEVLPRLLG